MADSRFYDNRGPFRLDQVCAHAGIAIPDGAGPGSGLIFDVAGLGEAGPPHLSFFNHARAQSLFSATKAGWCLVGKNATGGSQGTVLIRCPSVAGAFGRIAALFYPEYEMDIRAQSAAIDPSARLEEGVVIAPGVIIGPGAVIGRNTRIGAHAVIGRGVTVGRSCEIGAHAVICFAHMGDFVVVQPGAVIGSSGFGYSSGANGHSKVPHLGRVILQDHTEIGAHTTIDRGALSDTVIGEGTKIDNLVQIGHNTRIGRHCLLAAQNGLSGSIVLGDFVVIGGMAGIKDHVTVGDGVQIAAKSGITGNLEGGVVYGGFPAVPIKQWRRQIASISLLAKRSKRTKE